MRFLFVLVLIAFFGFLTSQRFLNPQLNHNTVADRLQHPFDTRLRYKIGKIDPRFNISHDQLMHITQQAADIWFLGTQKQFFVYDEHAQLSINLIYDHRQVDSEARLSALSQIEQSKTLKQSEYEKLNQAQSLLHNEQQRLQQQQLDYKQRLDRYNQEVNHFNQASHPSPAMYTFLQQQKQQLNDEAKQIQQQLNTFNEQVNQVNQQVSNVNQLNHHFNHTVDQFNQRFQARQFDKGQFNGREINIYEFQDLNDLKLTLAHELGHGLGILHSNDPESLMYPILEKQNFENFSLTAGDLALLNKRL